MPWSISSTSRSWVADASGILLTLSGPFAMLLRLLCAGSSEVTIPALIRADRIAGGPHRDRRGSFAKFAVSSRLFAALKRRAISASAQSVGGYGFEPKPAVVPGSRWAHPGRELSFMRVGAVDDRRRGAAHGPLRDRIRR